MKKSFFLLIVLLSKFANAQFSDDGRVIRIPVIFHVIYSDRTHDVRPDRRNTNENLPTAVLLNELQDLNRDFLLLNTDTSQVIKEFKKIIGNAKVEFYLADTILQPGGERGIIRVKDNRNRSKLYKRSDIIDHTRFFNVYVGNIGGSFAPSSTPWTLPTKDAVFLGFEWIGLGYRLLTHEAGHWFGLLHVFGGSGGAEGDFCKGTGDDINDTPPQATSTDEDCDRCPPIVKDQSCTVGMPSNYNNFMDYSGCRKMFTLEQVHRIRENLFTHRNFLWNNDFK